MRGNRALRRLCRSRVTVASALFLFLLVSVAAFGDRIAPYSPYDPDFDSVAESPSPLHWLGTDELGRDILSRLIYGARTSLLIGIAVQTSAGAIGALVGLASGYYGGIADITLMRLVDVLYSFPSFLLVVVMVSVLDPGTWSIIITLSFVTWPLYARLVRGQVLSLREQEFVLATHALGATDTRILLRHILPNTLGVIVVQFTLGIGYVIMAEASLSFLGIGIRSPHVSWGAMINKGREYFLGYPHMTLFPSIVLALTVLAFNLLGDGLRDALDPRLDKGS